MKRRSIKITFLFLFLSFLFFHETVVFSPNKSPFRTVMRLLRKIENLYIWYSIFKLTRIWPNIVIKMTNIHVKCTTYVNEQAWKYTSQQKYITFVAWQITATIFPADTIFASLQNYVLTKYMHYLDVGVFYKDEQTNWWKQTKEWLTLNLKR